MQRRVALALVTLLAAVLLFFWLRSDRRPLTRNNGAVSETGVVPQEQPAALEDPGSRLDRVDGEQDLRPWRVRVVDETGAILGGGQVSLQTSDGSWIEARSDGAGHFVSTFDGEVQNLRACGFESHYPANRALARGEQSRDLTIVAQSFASVDVEILRADGQPWDSPAAPWFEPADQPVIVASRDPVGHWLVQRPPVDVPFLDGVYHRESSSKGRLLLTYSPPCWIGLVLGQSVLEWRSVAGAMTLRFVITSAPEELFGAVRFCVAGSSTSRSLSADYWILAEGNATRPASFPTDDSGCARLSGIPPGEWVLGLAGSGRGESRLAFTVLPGQELDLGVIQSAPDGYLAGVFDGELGSACNYRDLLAWDGERWSALGLLGPFQGQQGYGRFAIGQLPPGKLALSIRGHGAALNPSLIQVSTGMSAANVRVQRGVQLSLRFVRACEEGRTPFRLRLREAGGQLVWQGAFADTRLTVLPGAYVLEIFDGLGIDQRTITVEPTGTELCLAY